MMVAVRCLANLAVWSPPAGRLDLAADATVADAAAALRLPAGEVGTVLRNGAAAETDTPLAPGDRLSFVPPITGG